MLDVNALHERDLDASGRIVGGVTYTSSFLTGGIFSYDGVHPTDLGYAIIANEWIRLINANGGRAAGGRPAAVHRPGHDRRPRRPRPRQAVPHTAWEFPPGDAATAARGFPALDQR